MTNAKMPAVGLVSLLPTGWVPDDANDPQFKAVVDERSDAMLGNADDWRELFERAAESEPCRDAAVAFFNEPTQRTARFMDAAFQLKWALMAMADESAREELTHE